MIRRPAKVILLMSNFPGRNQDSIIFRSPSIFSGNVPGQGVRCSRRHGSSRRLGESDLSQMRRESGSKLCGRAFQPVDDVQLDLIVVAQSKTVARRAEEWTPLSTLWTDVTERFPAASHAKTQLGCKQPSENVCGSPVPCGLAVHRAICRWCRGQSRSRLARRALSNPETTDQPPRCCRTREMCRCTSVT